MPSFHIKKKSPIVSKMKSSWTYPVLVVILIGCIFLHYKSVPEKNIGKYMTQLKCIVTKSKVIHQTMVSVSHSNCRKLFQIEGFHRQQFSQEDKDMENLYMRLSEELPPTTVEQGLMIPSRLQITGGSVPYLPCRVKLYNSKKLQQCFLLRNSTEMNGSEPHDKVGQSINNEDIAKTWVAFVGDSKMRGKFAAMVLSLKHTFNWTARWDAGQDGHYVKVDLEYIVTTKNLNGMRVVSTDGLMQIDFVGATRGVGFWLNKGTSNKFPRNRPFSLLHQWATTPQDIPHLIVIGHGLWSLLQLYESFLAPFDDLLKEWKQTADFLVNLSAHTNILVWKQSRKRDFAVLDHLKRKKFKLEDILKNYVVSKQALEWIDFTMHLVLKNSGLTLWDSSLPFNLATIRECIAIREVLHRIYTDDNTAVYRNDIHTSEKSKPQRNISIQELMHYDMTVGDRENKVDSIAFMGDFQQKVTENEEKERESIIKGELSEKRTQFNIKISSNENVNGSNKSLEIKQRRDNNSKEVIYGRYDMLLRNVLVNSIDIRGTQKLNSSKKYNFIKYNDDTHFNNYIHYLADALLTKSFQDLETLYNSTILKCRDGVHNSELTIQDEIHMIYNLLCNQYETQQYDLCCQE